MKVYRLTAHSLTEEGNSIRYNEWFETHDAAVAYVGGEEVPIQEVVIPVESGRIIEWLMRHATDPSSFESS